MSEEERSGPGNKLDQDLCVIDNTDFFVRGRVEIPIVGQDDKFVWGLWVSVSQANFHRILDLWSADVENEPPMFGWLSNNVASYPETFSLKTNVSLRNDGLRPVILLEATDHPFAVDQRNGISLAKVEELVSALLPHH